MSEGGWGDTQKGCRNPKTMTVTWMVTLTRLIPVTVDTFDAPKRCQNPKTMTVTWTVTLTRLIPVTTSWLLKSRRLSKPQISLFCWSPIFSEAPKAVIGSISNLPKTATKDQRIERPEDQGTRGPGDQDQGTRTRNQRTRGPDFCSREAFNAVTYNMRSLWS